MSTARTSAWLSGHRLLAPALLVLILAVWEVTVRVLEVPRFVLPPPTMIYDALVESIGGMGRHIRATGAAIAYGYLAGALAGFALAGLMTFFPAIRATVYPLVLATQTTPKIAIAPLLIVWFGVGLAPKVIIVALLAFFPILINTMAGLQGANPAQLRLLKSVNASQWDIYRHVRVPNAIPHVFAGLKLALTVSIIGAIVGEWIASDRGLGFLLVFHNMTLNTPSLFAVLIVLVVLASAAFVVIGFIERRLSWEARIQRSTTRTVEGAATPEGAL